MRTRMIPLIVSVSTALAGSAMADSLDVLQGAWTTGGIDCSETFKTVDGKVRFQDRGATLNTGVIISGSTITGGNQTCTASRIHKEKDRITVSLSCANAIIFSDMSVSFRMIDDQSFVRFDPLFSDILTTYHRCSP